MPPVPPVPPVPTVEPDEPHRHREMAESFGSDAARYDRARPRYPDALVAAVADAAPGPDVLDVGCGTGIAARQFRAAGCRVLGVDVDARMAAFARDTGLEVEVAAFETWDAGGRTFDAVVAGQTWHWLDPPAGAARASGLLRPGGRLAVFWNVFRPPADVAEAFREVHRRVMPDAPLNPWTASALDGYAPILTRASDGIRRTGTFSEPEQWWFEWARTSTRDEWLEQLATSGGADRIPPATWDAMATGIGGIVDDMGGSITMPYTTVAITAVRLEGGP